MGPPTGTRVVREKTRSEIGKYRIPPRYRSWTPQQHFYFTRPGDVIRERDVTRTGDLVGHPQSILQHGSLNTRPMKKTLKSD